MADHRTILRRLARWGGLGAGIVLICLALTECSARMWPANAEPQETRQVVDPTENVKALSEAAGKRQDDLRAAQERLFDAKLEAQAELFSAKLEAQQKLDEERARANKELREAAVAQLNSEARLRAEFAEKINTTEKGRVDAIRLVDKNAVDVATAQAVATATALAKTVSDTAQVQSAQVARTADDLRTLVQTTAAETNRNTQQQFTAISTRVTALETGSAEGLGRSKYQDPATIELTRQVAALVSAQQASAGAGAGSANVIAYMIGVLGLLFGGVAAFAAFRRRELPQPIR